MARSGLWSPLLFPSLANIGYEFAQFFSRTDRLLEAWTSLHRALGGFALAAVTGVVIGMLMGRSAFVAGLLDPLFSGTYAVPKLALFPIFIFAFGIGSLSKVALVFLECLYPIVIITCHGARGVDRVLLWSAQNMGAAPDPFRPRLRRRGAGVVDERASRADSEPGQEIPAQADPVSGQPGALPSLSRRGARWGHGAGPRGDLRPRAGRRYENRRQRLPGGSGEGVVQHHVHGERRRT